MLKIWGRRSSFNVQKVMWLVGELGLAHEHIDAGGSFGGLDTPGFLAMNPHGRVPVIADGDAVVWEFDTRSFAISPRVTAPGASGPTIQPRGRASRVGWTRSQTSLQPDFLTGVFWGFYRTPEGAAELAGDQSVDRAMREALWQAGPLARRPDLPAGRRAIARRHHRGHVALSLLRARDRASVITQRGTLVSRAGGALSLPHPRHDPFRGVVRAARLLASRRALTSSSGCRRP